eukprot:GHVL01016201.1.p1 GENE.GHVL01016201.1~~GHVL01016201.1.p1  ORF type:complete len:635 (-),score=99.95 GHVL01016201.1:383-2287(-)
MPSLAKSGHPGAPLGCAPMAHALFGRSMKFSAKDPKWLNRDRFVLSNGHASALLYTMMHLCGYDITLDDLKDFRKIHSKTAGHPESNLILGVEVTTGPLGQGISNAVGMAIAERMMAQRYNTSEFEIINNHTLVICSDGDLMEGVSSEASSLAGHLGLNKLIVLYDNNGITIDGSTNLAFTEDVGKRYEAYGWRVVSSNNDFEEILKAILEAKNIKNVKPTMIMVETVIGFGTSLAGTSKVHGAPLSEETLKQMKESLTNDRDRPFKFDEEVLNFYKDVTKHGNTQFDEWKGMLIKYSAANPILADELNRRLNGAMKVDWKEKLRLLNDKPNVATRAASGKCLNLLYNDFFEIVGGSADLTESNAVSFEKETFSKSNHGARLLSYGVREHAMFAIANGLFSYGGFRPFCATFYNFLTYGWGAARLAALSKMGILFLCTHDSIELGEDGPTHQPIEVSSLVRATPNMLFCRPSDANETTAMYSLWLTNKERPTVLSLCRSGVPLLERSNFDFALKGGYIIEDSGSKCDALIGSSGSEVWMCVEAKRLLDEKTDVCVRVVSLPCWEVFLEQSEEYQKEVLLSSVGVRLYVETAAILGTPNNYFNSFITMREFGLSGAKNDILEYFGYTRNYVSLSC